MMTANWPDLPFADWRPTKETLHRWCQIVGKVRLDLVPFRNHWWHVPLYVSTRGLTTGSMPANGRRVSVDMDFVGHRVTAHDSLGTERTFRLEDGLTVSEFYEQLLGALSQCGVTPAIRPVPFDLADSPAFPDDGAHASYQRDAVERFHRLLGSIDEVLHRFAGRFSGKASPVHLFWHSFDLAYTRFSGRRAPPMPDADPVTREAYSHEVISFGFWAGDEQRPFPAFYAYAAPEPRGLTDAPLQPEAARWDAGPTGSLALLPYDDIRTLSNPGASLLDFFESAYLAGADAAGWDTDALQSSRKA